MREWRTVVGNEDYEVSSDGLVRSLYRKFIRSNGKLHFCYPKDLKPTIDRDGYHRVAPGVRGKGKPRPLGIHRLVAQAFIPNPENKPEVNHKNGIKSDNRVENLEWCTVKENAKHAADLGLKARGERSGPAKLTEKDVLDIRATYRYKVKGFDTNALAEKYGVSNVLVSRIVRRKSWKHI